MARRPPSALRDALSAAPVYLLHGLLGLLPWRLRVAAGGALGRAVIPRLAHLRKRAEANLALVMPELDAAARDRTVRAMADQFGRVAVELLFGRDLARARPWRAATGPGVEALQARLAAGQGAIILSGHFGAWEIGRAWITAQGKSCAAVYRPLRNRYLERLYHASIARTGAPMIQKGRRNVRAIARHVAEGGVIALLVDQHETRGTALDFLGHPAPTTLVAAELGLRYNVPLIPAFVIRSDDGVSATVEFDAPIPPGPPAAMMQAFNDALAARVRAHPGQYFWLHRRWRKSLD